MFSTLSKIISCSLSFECALEIASAIGCVEPVSRDAAIINGLSTSVLTV